MDINKVNFVVIPDDQAEQTLVSGNTDLAIIHAPFSGRADHAQSLVRLQAASQRLPVGPGLRLQPDQVQRYAELRGYANAAPNTGANTGSITGPNAGTPHQHRLRVYYADTDAGGVVYFGSYGRFLERAAIEYRRAAGLPLLGAGEHHFMDGLLEIDWRAAYAKTSRDAPYESRFQYGVDADCAFGTDALAQNICAFGTDAISAAQALLLSSSVNSPVSTTIVAR